MTSNTSSRSKVLRLNYAGLFDGDTKIADVNISPYTIFINGVRWSIDRRMSAGRLRAALLSVAKCITGASEVTVDGLDEIAAECSIT